jgi:Amino acid permease/RimK-like ATP-grasp domain
MADNKRAVGSVTYRDAEHGYFEKRKLRRHAAFWSLWALGVGAVISGDFYGWNLGLDAGGFGGLLIAGIVITIMYYGLCFSIAEMSPALPHTGGAYSFSRSAMGPWGGFVTGLAENMEYVITPAVVVGAMGFLSHDIVFDLTGADGWWNSPVLWWAIYYIIFVGINIMGIEITMRFTVIITVAALAVLAFFFVAVLFTRSFDSTLLTNIPPEEGGTSFLPKGIAGIFPALPFAIWFYLAIEELPLAAEESHDPKRDIPRATIWGLTTLMLFAVGILFLNTGVGGGAAEIGTFATPFFDGFKAVFGEGVGTSLLGILALIGLIDHKVVAAALRRPAEVVGTGHHTVRELIDAQSRRRAAATGGESRIPLDDITEATVREAGWSFDDVLPEGVRLRVRRTANLHQGGTIHDVTAEVNPELCTVAVTAADAIGIPVTGIDLLVPDVTGTEYVFIEANERPGLANHEPQPTAQAFVDFLFPQSPGLPQAWTPDQPAQ